MKEKKILTSDRYLSNFVTFIIPSYYIVRWFWYPPPSALVLSMIQMWYIYYLFITIGSFIVYDNYADQRDIDVIYLVGC